MWTLIPLLLLTTAGNHQAGGTAHVVPDTLRSQGEAQGIADGHDAAVRGNFLGGLAWSAVLGPVGGIVATRRAGSASLPFPTDDAARMAAWGGEYDEGYRHGFQSTYAPRRREAAIVGSMVGSVAWSLVILRLVTLPHRADVQGSGGGDPPTFQPRISVPVPRP